MIRFLLQPRIAIPLVETARVNESSGTPIASTSSVVTLPTAPTANAPAVSSLFRTRMSYLPIQEVLNTAEVSLENLSWMDILNIAAPFFEDAEGDLLFEKIPMNQSRGDTGPNAICRLPEGVPINTPASELQRPDDCELYSPPFMSGTAYAQARVMSPADSRTATFPHPERPRIINFGIDFHDHIIYRIRRTPAPMNLRVDGLRGVDVVSWQVRPPENPGSTFPRFTIEDGNLDYERGDPQHRLPIPFGVYAPPPPHDHFVMFTEPTPDNPLSTLQRTMGIQTQRLYVDTYKSDLGIEDRPFPRQFGDLLRSFTQLGDACHRQQLHDNAWEYNPNTHRVVTRTVTETINGVPVTRQERHIEEIPVDDPNYLPLFDFLGTDMAKNRRQIEGILDHEWQLMQAEIPESERRRRQVSDLPAIVARAFPHGFLHLRRTRDHQFNLGGYHLTFPAHMPTTVGYRLEVQTNPQTGQYDLDRGLEMVIEFSRFEMPPLPPNTPSPPQTSAPSDSTRVILRNVQMPVNGGMLQAESIAARNVRIRIPLSPTRTPERPLVCPAPIQEPPAEPPSPIRIELEGLALENTQFLQSNGGIGFGIGQGNLEKISFARNAQGEWHIEWGDPQDLGLQGTGLEVFAPIQDFPGGLTSTRVHIPRGIVELTDLQNYLHLDALDWWGSSGISHADSTPVAQASGSSHLSDITYSSLNRPHGREHRIDFNYSGNVTGTIQDPQAHRNPNLPPAQIQFTTQGFENIPNNLQTLSGLAHFVGLQDPVTHNFTLQEFRVVVNAPSVRIAGLESRPFQPIPFKQLRILPEITDGQLDNTRVEITDQGWGIFPLDSARGPAHVALQLERSTAIYLPEIDAAELRAHPNLVNMYSVVRMRRSVFEGFINEGQFEWVETRNPRGQIERGVRTVRLDTGPLMMRHVEAQDNRISLHTNTPMWNWIGGYLPCVGVPCPGQVVGLRPSNIPPLPDRNALLMHLSPEERALLGNGDFIRADGIHIRSGENANTQICGLMAYLHEEGGRWHHAMMGVPEFTVIPNGQSSTPGRRPTGSSSENPFGLPESAILDLYLSSPAHRLNGESGAQNRGPYVPSPNCQPVDARLFTLFRPRAGSNPRTPTATPVVPAAVVPTPNPH